MFILSSFDRNPISTGIKSHSTTVLGSIIGILSIIALTILGVSKIIQVLNREVIYINYWRTQQSWDVGLHDMEVRFKIYGGAMTKQAYQIIYGYQNQQTQNLNNILDKNLNKNRNKNKNRNSRKQKLIQKYIKDNNGSFVKLNLQKLTQIGLKTDITIATTLFPDTKIQQFDLITCEDDKEYLCIPPNLNVSLYENCLLDLPKSDMKDVKINFYKDKNMKNGKLNSNIKSLLQTSNIQNNIFNYKDSVLIIHLQFTDKSINPKLMNPRYSTPTIVTQLIAGIKDQQSSFYYHEMYFSSFNVTTQNNIYPSFASSKQTKIYWKHESGYDYTGSYDYSGDDFLYEIGFNRVPISVVYQRSYKKIDSALSEILGISALIGVIVYFLFGHYSSWSNNRYLLIKTKQFPEQKKQEDNQQIKKEQMPSLYIKNLFRSASCNKNTRQLIKEENQRLRKINTCGDLVYQYQQSLILLQVENKMEALESLLCKDKNFKQKYQQEMEQLKQKKLIKQATQQIIENQNLQFSKQQILQSQNSSESSAEILSKPLLK